jgi:pimeloyl-ACP methyl ester carboxylesterase
MNALFIDFGGAVMFCSRRRFGLLVVMVVAIATAIFSAHTHARPAQTAFKVDVSGKGAPMILIPGLTSSGEVWKETVAKFSDRYECHVLTLAGFAGVPPVTEPSLASVKKQIVEYIDAKQMKRPVVVGHSLGGFMALSIAADFPDKLGKIVIVDSLPALGAVQMPDITPDQLKSMAGRMREASKTQDADAFAAQQKRSVQSMVTKPEDVERVLAWGKASDKTTVLNAMHDLMASDLRNEVALIKVPALVLGSWYAYKDFTKRAAVENTFKTQYQKLAGATIALSDTGLHFLMYDDPQWMFAQMEKFLK